MTVRRKVLTTSAIGALALLVATAVPGIAGKPVGAKTIGWDVAPATAASNTSTTFTVTLYNTSPGNSNPNSFLIKVPAGYDIGAAGDAAYVSGTTSNLGRTVTADPVAETASVTGLDPLKSRNGAGPVVVISVKATTPNVTSCGGSLAGQWDVVGYTGSSLTGDMFVRADATFQGNITTTVSVTCALAFDPAPANGVINSDISTTVKITGGSSTEDITLKFTAKPTDAIVKLDGSTRTGDELTKQAPATFVLQGNTVGSYTVQASSSGLTSVSATFTLFGAGINCQGTSGGVQGGDPQSTATLERTDNGPNGNGTGCVQVPYTLTPEADRVILLKDNAVVAQQGAQFKITVTWGLLAAEYPTPSTTTFDLDGNLTTLGDQFTPDNCAVVGGDPQYPANPNEDDVYWPATSTNSNPDPEEPWCFAGSSVVPSGAGFQVTETFLGSGDPSLVRTR